MQIEACKVRKGMKVFIGGLAVEVTKREKWNSTDVKIHIKDCGCGLPMAGHLNRYEITAVFFKLKELLDLVP